MLKHNTPYDGPETCLQKQLDDMLGAYNIWSFHFPDSFFRWIKMNAPAGIQKWFFGKFGGVPDTIAMLPITDKYMLCCAIELKTARGKLHGKQKHWREKGLSVQISRSPEQNIAIIIEFIETAKKIKNLLTNL